MHLRSLSGFGGVRRSGTSWALRRGHLVYVGWLVGAFLLVYALAILLMSSYALTLAYVYGVYVALNVVIFTFTYPSPKDICRSGLRK